MNEKLKAFLVAVAYSIFCVVVALAIAYLRYRLGIR